MRASKVISFFPNQTARETHIYKFHEAAKVFYPLEELFLLNFYHSPSTVFQYCEQHARRQAVKWNPFSAGKL
jgi:hypothetical protein